MSIARAMKKKPVETGSNLWGGDGKDGEGKDYAVARQPAL